MADKKKKKNGFKNTKPTVEKAVEKHEKSVLLLLKEEISAGRLAAALDFLSPKQIEVWTDVNFLEITFEHATLTFEDIREDLQEADTKLLQSMGKAMLYACDYVEEDSTKVKEVMQALCGRFEGTLASDTEDFKPFLAVEEL